jgi:hypothetical protein
VVSCRVDRAGQGAGRKRLEVIPPHHVTVQVCSSCKPARSAARHTGMPSVKAPISWWIIASCASSRLGLGRNRER